jgi:hypothetical protein
MIIPDEKKNFMTRPSFILVCFVYKSLIVSLSTKYIYALLLRHFILLFDFCNLFKKIASEDAALTL